MRHLNSNSSEASPHEQMYYVRPGTSNKASTSHRWGVVLAGGDGTRLQPLTRLACGDDRPKQFCPLLAGQTLLAHTRQRISRTVAPDHVLFVLTKKHEPFYQEELRSVPGVQKIVQPQNQGTLPAILWSLLRLFRTDEHSLVAFFPSDHYFANEGAFIAAVERTFQFADEERGSVFLLGAGAERPETEYGWIEPEYPAENHSRRAFSPVRRFWEKPSLEIARDLLKQGCLWNTFVMIGSAGAFLEMIRKTSPVLFETFDSVLLGNDLESEEQSMQFVYDSLEPYDFSRKVLTQSTERLFVANCGEVGWSDLGEPHRFIAALADNDIEDPGSASDICNRCGLTRDQIVTLYGHEKVATPRSGYATLTSS